LENLALPEPAVAGRADGLWQTTCFEVFLRGVEGESYCEYNFSPSSQWAAYSFENYRMGMGESVVDQGLEILLDASEGHFAMEVVVVMPSINSNMAFGDSPHPNPSPKGEGLLCGAGPKGEGLFEAGLSAIIEELDGTKSYWALAHPPGKPDFHHADCFALRLAAAGAV
jgi:hypothetical protein